MSDFHKKIYDMLMESQYWSPERMQEYQRSQLAQLLRHARANVPFYKDRLDPIFKTNGDIDWQRWNEIPIVKRHHLAEQRSSMLATYIPPGHGDIEDVYSSGTSGKPIIISHNHLAMWISELVVYRAYQWHGMNWSKNFLTLSSKLDEADWPSGVIKGRWGPSWLPDGERGTAYVLNRATPAEKMIEFICRNRIQYVAGRPTSLHALGLETERLGMELKLDSLVAYGGGVTEVEKEDLQRIFGARTISLYSSGECYKMAINCDTGNHFHINSESAFLEILNDENKPTQVGQPGRVVVTTLYNTAQPLIRYEQGDMAVSGQPCVCGKSLPVIQKISGRINDLFRLPNGIKISASLPDRKFCTGFGTNVWQIVQTAPLSVEVRYVLPSKRSEVNQQFAVEMIRKNLHSDMEITFKELDEIPLTPAGKFLQYKCELEAFE